jgi:uncharacterized protein
VSVDESSVSIGKASKNTIGSVSRRRSWKQSSAKWIRWLHIYGSMFSCAVVLFFSVTGITLNHPDWFGGESERVREATGSIPVEWVTVGEASVSRLEVVEHLRKEGKARGAMKDFTIDENQCIVAFRSPGYTADVFIDRTTGKYDLVESAMGWVAVMNDLHKGRDSGLAWSWLIDLSAALLVFVSGTGLLLLFYINRHRRAGLVTAVFGILVTVLVYVSLVP